MKTRSFAPGFTLVELLVVLAIIGLLVAIAVPLTQSIVHRSRAAACTGNLNNLGAGLQLYLAEHSDTLPSLKAGRLSLSDPGPTVDEVLFEYVQSVDVFACPDDHAGLWEKSGTSYLWNNLLNGQNVTKLNFLGSRNARGIPILADKENFHRDRGDEVNILYADGHIDKELQFVAGP